MSLPFPLWFSAFLLSKGSAAVSDPTSTTTTIPLTTLSSILSAATTTTAAITPSTSAMTNYIIPQQPSTPIEIMDRKKKKPVMEKQRRDRMNNALERLKVIIIRHDPNHTSKLEKADILEKTVELVEFFEFQLSQIQQQITAQTIGTIFDGLARNKCSPEIIKSVRDVILSIFPPPGGSPHLRQPHPLQHQNIIPSTAGTAIPSMMPTFNAAGRIPPPPPIHPLFLQAAAMNPLLIPTQQRLPQTQPQFFPQFNQQKVMMMQQAPKASSAPVMTPPSSSSASSTTTSTSASGQIKSEANIHSSTSPTKTYETESRSNSRAAETDSSDNDDDDNEDDVIDVEKVDEEQHDETFSPPTSPKNHQQINSRKRRRNSSTAESSDTVAAAGTEEEDDSGIFDGPSPPKKPARTTFSIDGILK